MKWSLFALCIGFCIDLLIGDPHGLPHPVAAIGHLDLTAGTAVPPPFRRRPAASGPPEPVSGS